MTWKFFQKKIGKVMVYVGMFPVPRLMPFEDGMSYSSTCGKRKRLLEIGSD
jgi:hypothetical protein